MYYYIMTIIIYPIMLKNTHTIIINVNWTIIEPQLLMQILWVNLEIIVQLKSVFGTRCYNIFIFNWRQIWLLFRVALKIHFNLNLT